MKVNGIEMQDAGYIGNNNSPCCVEPSESKKNEKQKCYSTIYSNDKEMPLNLSGIKSGDKLMLVCLVNVKEYTSVDIKGKKDEPSERFTLEILKCGCEKTTDKSPADMDDKELNEAIDGKKKEEKE